MTEFELINKLTAYKAEMVAPFEIATTREQWAELLPKETIETVEDMTNYYLSHLSVFEKTAVKITFPECNLTENDLCNAIEELTRGFDKEKCRLLLDTLTRHRERLLRVCNEYQKTWNKPTPIEFVCSLLENKLTDEQPTAQPEIMTDRAKRYFVKAINAGYMEQAGNGYKWTFNVKGRKAAWGYFLLKVYSPDNSNPQTIHYKALEGLFGEKRLDRAIAALFDVKKPQTWRSEIDSLFEE